MAHDDTLLELYGALRRKIAKDASLLLRASGLGLRQFIILKTLADGGRHQVGELTEFCMTDAGTVSRAIAQLRDQGLVEKEQSDVDGRVWVVRLTKKGRGKVPQIRKIYGELGRRAFAHLGDEDRTRLAQILGKLTASDD